MLISTKIKTVCIVGFGSIGRKHFAILRENYPNIEIILVRSGKGTKHPEEKKVNKITNCINEAIKLKPDAVFICTPASFHISQSLKFIRKKIPTFIEKPLSLNLDGIENFEKLVKNNKAIVLIGYVLRYSKSLNFFKKNFHKKFNDKFDSVKVICKSYLPYWRPNYDYKKSVSAIKKLGGGVLLELSHEIDYSNWIFGNFKLIESKLSNSGKLNIEVEDNAKLKITTNKGKYVDIFLNFHQKKKIRKCICESNKRILTWDGLKNEVILEYKNKKKKWNFNEKKNEIYKGQIKHFFDCITKSKKPNTSLKDSVKVLKIISAAVKSNKQKKIINIYKT